MLKLLTDHNNREDDLVSLSLDEIARLGARKLLTQALALEVNEYIERSSALRDDAGLRQVVRNGSAKERKITTGSGTIAVRAPPGPQLLFKAIVQGIDAYPTLLGGITQLF